MVKKTNVTVVHTPIEGAVSLVQKIEDIYTFKDEEQDPIITA